MKIISKRIRSVMALVLALSLLLGVAATASAADQQPENIRVYGVITDIYRDEYIKIRNSNPYDPYQEVELKLGKDTLVLDAVTGKPVEAASLEKGDTLYAYVSAKMETVDEMPRASAQLILCSIPMDFGVPDYYTVRSAYKSGGDTIVNTDKFNKITISADCEFVSLVDGVTASAADLTEGTNFLVWKTYDELLMSTIYKVMIVDPDAGKDVDLPSDTVKLTGTITKMKADGRYLLVDANKNSYVLGVDENTAILDVSYGQSMPASLIREGSYVTVYAGSIMALSYPPQTSAVVILCNGSADQMAPEYFVAASVEQKSGIAIVTTEDGKKINLTGNAAITKYLSMDRISYSQVKPGMRLLAWSNGSEKEGSTSVYKAIAFEYEYDGYLVRTEDGIYANQTKLPSTVYKSDEGHTMVPLRRTCEALGLTAKWDAAAKTYTVARDGEEICTIAVGADAAQMADGTETTLLSAAEYSGKTVFLSAYDLAHLVNAYTRIY